MTLRGLIRTLLRRTADDLDALRGEITGRVAMLVRVDPLVTEAGVQGVGRFELQHIGRLTTGVNLLVDRWAVAWLHAITPGIRDAATLGSSLPAVTVARHLRRHRRVQEQTVLSDEDRTLLRTLGLEGSPVAEEVIRQVHETFLVPLVQQLADESKLQLGRIIRQGIIAGTAPYTLMGEVSTFLLGTGPNAGLGRSVMARAESIIRTETGRAYDQATQGRMEELSSEFPELAMQKRWVSLLDHRTRPAHFEAHGQTVPVAEPFIVGGEPLLYPHDPKGSPGNTINCRCTHVLDIPGLAAAA